MFIQIQTTKAEPGLEYSRKSNIQYFIVLASLRAQYIYLYVPWKSRTSKKYVHMKIRRKWVKKYVHVKSLWCTFWGLLAKKEHCYKHPVDVPFEALWLKRNVAITCYNMLYHHALKPFCTSKVCIQTRYWGSIQRPKKQVCACMHRGSALRSVQFLQNVEKSKIVSNRE